VRTVGVVLRSELPAAPGRTAPPWWPFLAAAATALVPAAVLGMGWEGTPLGLAAAAALLARLRPVAGAAGAVAAVLLGAVLAIAGVPEVPPPWLLAAVAPQSVIAFAVALASPARVAAVAWGALGSVGLVHAAAVEALPAGLSIWLLWVGAVGLAGLAGAHRRDQRKAVAELATAAAHERMRAEHDRLARELHDVVAHQLSELMVRAVSAPHRIPAVPAAASDEFAALGGLARGALGGMRQVLGVLRGDEPALREPQPGLAELPDLVAAARRSGVAVRAEIELVPAPGAATGLCAYRIVQEALSNVARHAGGASTVVRVRLAGERLRVEVDNEPPDRPVPPVPGAGLGLVGMRERARLLGGGVEAGPRPDGGFAVRAELPA
jgi:signal transduction histidine kinase